MARTDTLGNFLTDVAEAIRNKTGKTDAITPANFDTEITSINTNKVTKITKLIDVTMILNDYVNQILYENYDVYTNEQITLYTPADTHTMYCIRKDANGKYYVMWLPTRYVTVYNSDTSVQFGIISLYNFGFENEATLNDNLLSVSTKMVGLHISRSAYGTLEEAVAAIQNPTTSYTMDQMYSWAAYSEDGYHFPLSNMTYIGYNRTVGVNRRISDNETITVIPTTE